MPTTTEAAEAPTVSTGVRLEHAFVSVRSVGASLAFYGKLIPEWVVRWDGKGMSGDRWVHFGPDGDAQVGYLSLCEFPDAPASDEPYSSIRIQHVGFTHPDVDGLVSRLEREGIRPTERVDDGRYRRVYFADPDGHALEFVQKVR
jgi:catechol 2,3-dioxygenase-like lactoylglutathione lyase family enzyme